MEVDLGAPVLKPAGLAVSDYGSMVAINIFVALLCGCIVIGHLLEGNRWVNESITALVNCHRADHWRCHSASH